MESLRERERGREGERDSTPRPPWSMHRHATTGRGNWVVRTLPDPSGREQDLGAAGPGPGAPCACRESARERATRRHHRHLSSCCGGVGRDVGQHCRCPRRAVLRDDVPVDGARVAGDL